MNDFVNPQHRGVNLPPGCKDLMDVLKVNDAASETPIYALHSKRSKPLIERYERNGLQHAEKFVRLLLESRTKWASLTIFHKPRLTFTLVRFPDSVTAMFCFSEKEVPLERSVREIFTKFGRVPLADESEAPTKLRVVRYWMPGNVPGILEIAGELLQRAFEVPEDGGLDYIFNER